MNGAGDRVRSATVLLIATLDTKAEEALYLKGRMESLGCRVILMDTGILEESGASADVTRHEVAAAAGTSIEELLAFRDKGRAVA
ncbi:MAG: Tm-1-like ATP-binding domain-containing protein, partial [Deltaproteobacteria bacterium]|nr:Tm-1-like ATP-binding domain-containing protein [Deltaproteobacteria bacterium]